MGEQLKEIIRNEGIIETLQQIRNICESEHLNSRELDPLERSRMIACVDDMKHVLIDLKGAAEEDIALCKCAPA